MADELKASLRMADAKLRSVIKYAKGNAKAAKIKDEEQTWEAHAREVERVSKIIRGLLGKGSDVPVSSRGGAE